MSLKRRLYNGIPDWIWPHLIEDVKASPYDQEYFSVKHGGLFDEVNGILAIRLAQVEKRTQIVESKLVALLTLTSVLSVAVTASLAATTTLGTVDGGAKILAWLAVCLVFYVALQLIRSLWATVTGLVRKEYRQISPEEMTPRHCETAAEYRVRLLNLQVSCMRFNESAVDQKVSEMAVAHVALKNALTACFPLTILVFVIAVFRLA